MSFGRRTIPRPLVACAATVAVVLGLSAVPVSSSADPSLGQLKSQLGAEQAHQNSLASSISSLSHLISSLSAQIALVESREAAVRADLARDRAQLAAVQRALARERHLLALESDGGGGQPHALQLGNTAGDAVARATRWLPLFAPYGIAQLETGTGGADVGYLMAQGSAVGEIVPHSQRYFDVHHTTEDTIDKVNPRELQLGAAAMAALVYLVDQHGL